ncbi:class I SAM-dependent methyltransferase [Sulfolobus tengchongensis]|uniref:Class I SAM-dependent methyltransferase n=1 Tax=Sulfolobus tengchongensis TaxID=207809 RepID=A0AAX4KZU1_9CREN
MIFACPIDKTNINDNLECEKGHRFNLIDDGIYDFLLKDVKTDRLLERIVPIYENIWAPLGILITSGKTYSFLLSEIANFIEGEVIIDVGTGTGKIFDFLRCSTCVGIDVSIRFLKYLKRKRSKVVAVRGDANNLPLKSGIADGVSSTLVLHMLSNPSFAIKEINRVLKPNGRCSVIVLGNVNSTMAKILSRWWNVSLRHYDYYVNLFLENSLKVVERKELGPWEIIKCVKIS